MLLVILLFSTCTSGLLLPSKTLTLQEIHLVRCLTHISHTYLARSPYLVISSPSTYRDVQQELIAEIHRTAIWPVVVTVDGNISVPEKTDFIDGDGSYIILIPDGKYESVETEIYGLAFGQYKFNRIWKTESRFVVAGANEISLSQQRNIFHSLSKLRIYNCIIVSKVHDIIDKGYSRPINASDVDTGMKLGVYTWFPYRSSDRCTDVNDITLLDSWVFSVQGLFTKNTDLFPRKISNNLKACPIKADVIDARIYFYTNYVNHTYPNGSVVTYIEGLEMDLLRVVLKQMNMTFVHVPRQNGSSVMNAFFEKKVYIAFGAMDKLFQIASYLDNTNSYHTSRIRWYVPCSVKYPRWSSIFRILSVELWLVLIVSIVIAAISTTLVGRYSCTSEWQSYKTVKSSFTRLWSVILGVAVSTMPRTPSLRSLFFTWVCFSLAFRTVFQAFLTTFAIEPGNKPPIRNMDELLASGIKLAYTPFQSRYLLHRSEKEEKEIVRNRAICPSSTVCLNWAMYHKNVSILLIENFFEISYAADFYHGQNSEPLLCRLEDGVFLPLSLKMIMLYGDPMLRRVTEIIVRVFESGIYNYWISLELYLFQLRSRKIGIVIPFEGYYSFNLYHMQSAFYLLLMGWCLSAISFVVELLYHHVISKRM